MHIKQEEKTITQALVGILNHDYATRGITWEMELEQTPFEDSSKKPDVFVEIDGHEPVAIEAKFADVRGVESVERQAIRHLGRDYIYDSETPETAQLRVVMAWRYPTRLRSVRFRELEEELCRAKDLEYVVIRLIDGTRYQIPGEGFVKCDVKTIANTLEALSLVMKKVDADSTVELSEEVVEESSLDAQEVFAKLKKLGKKPQDLADFLGLTAGYVSTLATGRNPIPKKHHAKIRKFLSLDETEAQITDASAN